MLDYQSHRWSQLVQGAGVASGPPKRWPLKMDGPSCPSKEWKGSPTWCGPVFLKVWQSPSSVGQSSQLWFAPANISAEILTLSDAHHMTYCPIFWPQGRWRSWRALKKLRDPQQVGKRRRVPQIDGNGIAMCRQALYVKFSILCSYMHMYILHWLSKFTLYMS